MAQLLYRCLLDEVQVTPPALRGALLEIARHSTGMNPTWIRSLLNSKFSVLLRDVVATRYLEGNPGFEEYISPLAEIAQHSYFGQDRKAMSEQVAAKLQNAFERGNHRLDKINAALVMMDLAFDRGGDVESESESILVSTRFDTLVQQLLEMLDNSDVPSALAASWALAWIGESRMVSAPPQPEMLLRLYNLWRQSPNQAFYPAWAFGAQQLLRRDTFSTESWGDCDHFLRQTSAMRPSSRRNELVLFAALVVGWYRRAPWTDEELVQLIVANMNGYSLTCVELLENLGTSGNNALRTWQLQEPRQ